MSLWTLKVGDVRKSLADWGIQNVQRKLANQATDRLTFRQPTASLLDDPLFPAGTIVELYREDVRWFYGRAEAAKFIGDARRGGLSYTISGPWWYLESMGFRQKWKFRRSTHDSTLDEKFNSYVILGSTVDGAKQSIGDQIREVVNYAIEQGAPIQLEAEDVGNPYLPTLLPPSRPAWNVMAAEAIRMMCQSVPDIVAFWDYSTDPYPTLKFRRRARQTAVSLPALDEKLIPDLEMQPREDLTVPGVVIYYLSSVSANGLNYSTVTEDVYPPGTTGREPSALVAAINLEATSYTFSQAAISCEAIEPTSKEWWARRLKNLGEPNIKNLVIDPNSVKRETSFPNQLLAGQWAPWMGGNAASETIKATVSYLEESIEKDANGHAATVPAKTVSGQPVMITITATDLGSNTYGSASDVNAGEIAPIGLAQALYEAASVLHYDGQFTIVEQACSGQVGIGNVVNFSNGRPEWVSIKAQVYSLTEEIDLGRTTVSIGPPKHLGPDDFMELLRATRQRIVISPISSRGTGQSSFGGGGAVLGEQLQQEVPAQNQGGVPLMRFHDPATNGSGSATIDIAQLAGRSAAFYEQQVCIKDANGNLDDNWFIRLLATQPYRRV